MNIFDEFGFDVCGYGVPRKFLTSHLHNDHVTLVNDAEVHVARPLVARTVSKYKRHSLHPEIVPHDSYKPVKDFFFSPRTSKYEEGTNYILYLEDYDAVFIPECYEIKELIAEHTNYSTVVVSRVPRAHGVIVRLRELPPNVYLADNTAQGMTIGDKEIVYFKHKRTIPQCVPSLLDLRQWRGNPPS